jgi:RNA polymerase sigma-70 factor (ECF subfamily)
MIESLFRELLVAAQDGDEEAFAVLWRDLQPAVLRYFRVAAAEAAEDLAADTWVSVIGGLGRFRGDERAFRAWVFTMARHRAIDWRRQAARRPTRSVPAEQLAERSAPDDPAATVLEAQSTRAALALLAEMPADQAEVVALRCSAAWRSPRWPGSSANARVRCGCWPIEGCGGWPVGWRQLGWRGV